MAGRDIMACAQTGSGKTAAFVLPILNYILANDCLGGEFDGCGKPIGLIITPTRELAVQIYDESRKFAYSSVVKCACAYGGAAVYAQKHKISKGCHILVATPGRLKDFVDKGVVSFANLKFLVLDEADKMLDMGFLGNIKDIVGSSSMPDKMSRNTLMFSATFPDDVQNLASEFLNDYVFIVVGMVGAANMDVEQTVIKVEGNEKRNNLFGILEDIFTSGENKKILVFCETKRTADFLASYLCSENLSCTSIHGDRHQSQREEALAEFKIGIRKILVATSVAARGLDIKGVNYVINYDLPQNIDDYVHRIGRTGRVGNRGIAISFFCESTDGAISKNLVKILNEANQETPDWLLESAKYGHSVQTYHGTGKFGAKDIRKNQDDGCAAFGGPDPVEDEESWD